MIPIIAHRRALLAKAAAQRLLRYTYTGEYTETIDEEAGIQTVTLTGSGELTVQYRVIVAAVLQGGGGGNGGGTRTNLDPSGAAETVFAAGGSGGIGYVAAADEIELQPGTPYQIDIGAAGQDGTLRVVSYTPSTGVNYTGNDGGVGGATTAFALTAAGAEGGTSGVIRWTSSTEYTATPGETGAGATEGYIISNSSEPGIVRITRKIL